MRDEGVRGAVDGASYDVCVVGAGAAGITLAVELEGRGHRVLVLEAGGRDVEESLQEPYGSEVVGEPRHRGIHDGRVRVLGGTTKLWGGQVLELDPGDFDERAWVPGSGWPISKSALRPYYRRALEAEGLASALREDEEVWARLRQPAPLIGYGLAQYFSRWCPQPDFGVLHQHVLEHSEHLTVLLHASVVAIELAGERAQSVRCRLDDGTETAIAARDVVFCMGAIECSRFFLQPTPGTRPPWAGHRLLGAGFQDHIDADAAVVRPLDHECFHSVFDNVYLKRQKYHPKIRLGSDVQEERGLLNIAATMRYSSVEDERLEAVRAAMRRLARQRGRNASLRDLRRMARDAPLLGKQAYRYVRSHRAYVSRSAHVTLNLHCEQEPLGRSRVSLSEHRDSLGMLRTRLDWRISELELATMSAYVEVAARALRAAGLAAVTPVATLGTPEFTQLCRDSNHHMSGMRMSVEPRCGLVDRDLRVHGTGNVYVCSTAVFPTSGFSNPTHTLLALAMRLSDHLSGCR
jgi:choline dehydrogenase-like flavoprotein